MTANHIKQAKLGDKIVFKGGFNKGLAATITKLDPPHPITGEVRIEYDLNGKMGATEHSRVLWFPTPSPASF